MLPGRHLGLGSVIVLSVACDSNPRAEAAGETQPTAEADWIALFDGSDLEQWRGFRRDDVPASWRVENGTLAFTPVEDRAQRGDLITREQFSDFELELEWRISPGGNSGIMYRVSEDHPQTWHTGPEMQVLDDHAHQDGATPVHRAGALDDLVGAPDGAARPAGEWNQVRIVVGGNPERIGIYGHYAGGYLVSTALTQRHDLFGAAVVSAGTMDLLRYPQLGVGARWIPEYGSPDDPEMFPILGALSPLHNIESGTCYPATLLMISETDETAHPAHPYTFAAALQAAQECERPILLRTERDGFHWGGPAEQVREREADRLAFLWYALRGERP